MKWRMTYWAKISPVAGSSMGILLTDQRWFDGSVGITIRTGLHGPLALYQPAINGEFPY